MDPFIGDSRSRSPSPFHPIPRNNDWFEVEAFACATCGRLESVIGSPDCGRFVSRPSVSLDYAGKECRHRHLNNRLVGCSILIITDLFETAIGVHHITYHRRTIIDLLPQCYVVAYDLVFMVSEVDKVTMFH